MGRLEGKVAFITGAARGQGRCHAVALAREGADVILLDRCHDDEYAPYEMASPDDLAETVRLVEQLGRRAIARKVDVRDYDAMRSLVDDGVKALGRLDIVIANAGVVSYSPIAEMELDVWQQMIDVNLTGVFKTVRASVGHVIDGERGGSVVLISSMAGLKTYDHLGHYVAAKHGITGLAKTLASELGQHGIRVNSLHPTNVNTPMLLNPGTLEVFHLPGAALDGPEIRAAFSSAHALKDLGWIEPEDVSAAVLYLVSDDGRYVTGTQFRVDGGFLVR